VLAEVFRGRPDENLRFALPLSTRPVCPHQQTPFGRHAVTVKKCHFQTVGNRCDGPLNRRKADAAWCVRTAKRKMNCVDVSATDVDASRIKNFL
jgi:hypothetical protein